MRCALPVRTFVAIVLASLALAMPFATVDARSHAASPPKDVSLAELPPEARDVLEHVHTGGPFRYERDGVVFGNREHKLPGKPSGYYHEYTVPTPGARDRGARRLVCGGPRKNPHVCYYTGDHYRTFRSIHP